ncbi:MAG: hypothetical protein LBJ04_05585 [Sphingobacterium sp.]|jgi:hypothetical protein|uniref:hypothetical protein n=1 Tax=Sphingobacterium sp. TaxID=341027 RepID=UPI00281E98C3|nr:hypothetical protein [Sphingobacterium sp.]MDR0262680.1 hypothetical protein [Sphingobacterium sp.]
MKKKSKSTWGIFSCVFILVLAAMPSCKKHAKLPDENDETTHAVKFKIKDFEAIVTPLKKQSSAGKRAALNGATAEDQLLYQWTFDNSNAIPEVALDAAVVIDYDNGKTNYEFLGGWPSSGKSISFKGVKEIMVKIPTTGIHSLGNWAFDGNSSSTGPRALLLSYSLDKGNSFSVLSDTIKYPSGLSLSAKVPVSASLGNISLGNSKELWLKISLFAGSRDGGIGYSPTTGTFKMDNLMIYGQVNPAALPSKFYYHVFDAKSKAMVKSGVLNSQETFDVELPNGTYYLSLIAKNSTLPLIVAENVDFEHFYATNAFSEQSAELFAGRDTFEVKGSIERVLNLNRIYSEVKLSFTDSEDLSMIDSIQVKQLHSAFLYYPFMAHSNDQVDESVLTVVPHFTAAHQSFAFNQFMGYYLNNTAIKYQFRVFKEDQLLRTFELGSEIRNNVQIQFKGKLLETINGNLGFQVVKNEDWDDHILIEY